MTMDGVPAQPAEAAPVAVLEGAGLVRHQPAFSGRTGEYFGIWFVNLLLSIATLGIYSAWAKVRTERYFYGNTRLAGSSFDYLADPIAILKGRLVAYAVVIALGVSSQFLPVLYLLLILAVFALLPAIIVLGLRFRARNSAWRGLSFRFDRSIRAAYGPFLGWQVLTALTATLLYPLMKLRQHEFVVGGHSFGRKRFEFAGDSPRYYTPYLSALGMSLGLAIVMFAASALMFAGARVGDTAPDSAVVYGMFVVLALFYAGFFALGIFLRVRYVNLLWNNSRLGPHRFECSLRVRDMMWLYASNLAAIICTLGLAVPWAMIRLAQYRAAHFAVLAEGGIQDFVRDLEREHAATGAEMVDALDVGVDLGL